MASVLIVDDIQDVADSFAELVSLFGHEVRVAYCGEQALSEIELRPPDVVLVDLNMSEIDGCRLARRIREIRGGGIRLVAHTAYPRSRVASDVARAGFDAFVSKAAQPLELALAVQGRRGMPDLRATRFDRRKSLRSGSSRRRANDGCTQLSAAD